jgi:cytochrome b pre-mRNA-processing protein 3
MTAERSIVPMKLLARLFRSAPDPREALRPLWHRVVEISREREWYAACGVADTVAGRFDMITAVLALVILRMEKDGDLARDTSLLTELFVSDMDGQLRELGVGDIVVGKKIGKLMGALGGRITAYFGGTSNGRERMEEAVRRNVTLAEGGSAPCVANKLLLVADRLGRTSGEALLAGEIAG